MGHCVKKDQPPECFNFFVAKNGSEQYVGSTFELVAINFLQLPVLQVVLWLSSCCCSHWIRSDPNHGVGNPALHIYIYIIIMYMAGKPIAHRLGSPTSIIHSNIV